MSYFAATCLLFLPHWIWAEGWMDNAPWYIKAIIATAPTITALVILFLNRLYETTNSFFDGIERERERTSGVRGEEWSTFTALWHPKTDRTQVIISSRDCTTQSMDAADGLTPVDICKEWWEERRAAE